MKTPRCFALVASLAVALPGHAAVSTFTNGGGDSAYLNAANWSGASVPNTSAGDTAQIADGAAVTYTAGPDLTISNGGVLQVTNGSWTQVVGPAYIQLAGNGTILVDGGTFNQGTATSNPFNVGGTGNAFTVSAGIANIASSLNLNTGLTFLQSGGTINVAGAELDFNSTTSTLSGGTLNVGLITGVNAPGSSRFDISGGTLKLTGSSFNGIYAGGITQFINFTPGSTGLISFAGGSTTISDVQNFINAGVIEYNSGGTSTLSNFNITSDAGIVTLSLVSAIPEPATYAMMMGVATGLIVIGLRRRKVVAAAVV